MAQLVDQAFLQAYGNILGQRNQAIQGFGQSLLGGAAQVGAAAIGRKKDAQALQADIDRDQADVQAQTQQLIDELARIREAKAQPQSGAYESAMLEQAEADTKSKLQDIGRYQQELGGIGDVTFGNVYDIRKPAKLEPIGSAASKGRIMDIQAQRDLEKSIAGAEGRKAAEMSRKQAQLESENRAEARRIAAEERKAQRDAEREAKKQEQKQSGAMLSAGETTPIATNLNTIKGTIEHIRTGSQNKDKFGKFTGTTELAKSKITGSGFGETMRAGAKRLAVSQARVRTQGNPTESDIAAAQDVAGDIGLEYGQWLQNQLTVLDEAIGQTELQIKLTKDGPQKQAMIQELEAAKQQRAELGGSSQGAPAKSPVVLQPGEQVIR